MEGTYLRCFSPSAPNRFDKVTPMLSGVNKTPLTIPSQSPNINCCNASVYIYINVLAPLTFSSTCNLIILYNKLGYSAEFQE